MSGAYGWIDAHATLIAVCWCLSACGLLAGLMSARAAVGRMLLGAVVAVPMALGGAALVTLGLAAVPAERRAELTASAVAAIGIVLAALGFVAGLARPRDPAPEKLKRGTRVVIAAPGARWARRRRGMRFAGQAVPLADEAKHFKILGTTGTGKTTAIRGLVSCALARGDCAVIADPDGVYARDFYDPARGDVILNPFDPRSRRWNIFGEITGPADADHLARSLIADHPGEDRNWRAYARVFVAAVLRQMQRAGHNDQALLHRLLLCAPAEELARLLEATPAAPYLSTDNSRFFASVRAIANTHLAVLEHLAAPADANSLSVRHWLREQSTRRPGAVLFLPYRANQIATLRGVISTWLRLAVFETMNGDESDRPVWFIVDELDALGAVDGLKDALARLRKFGGRCVLGFQSIAQVTACYGAYDAQTIIENCGNALILRCSSSGSDGTAQYASRLVGEREVMREQVSRSQRGFFEKPHNSRTTVLQQASERAVLAAEIEQLPDLAGYLKFASTPEWRLVQLGDGR